MRFGSKTMSSRTKRAERKQAQLHVFYCDVLLLTTAYCVYAVYFFWVSVFKRWLMLLLLLLFLAHLSRMLKVSYCDRSSSGVRRVSCVVRRA